MKIAYVTSSLEGSGGPLPIPAVTRVLRNAGAHVEVFALTRRDGRALPPMLADGLQVHIREGGDRDHWAAARWLDRELTCVPAHADLDVGRARQPDRIAAGLARWHSGGRLATQCLLEIHPSGSVFPTA